LHNLLLAELTRRDQYLLSLKRGRELQPSDEGQATACLTGGAAQNDALIGADGEFSPDSQNRTNDGWLPHRPGQLSHYCSKRLPFICARKQVTAWLGPNFARNGAVPVRQGEYLNVVAIVRGTIEQRLWDPAVQLQPY
jgi:hypothetical protein